MQIPNPMQYAEAVVKKRKGMRWTRLLELAKLAIVEA
jgi:hypothetical protein